MAHRQQEKERRREERLARERAEARAAARRRRLQLALGGVIVLALVAAVGAFAVTGLGGDDGGGGGAAAPTADGVKLPVQQTSSLTQAAKAAGCTLQNPPIEGRGHSTRDFTAADYRTNPPTSGPHHPEWYQDGIYNPGDTPSLGILVHTLEHGRINVQNKTGTTEETVSGLEALLAEQSDGYHMLLFQNATGMKYAVAATAWGHLLGCPQMNDKVYDAVRTFRERYIDKGPEAIP